MLKVGRGALLAAKNAATTAAARLRAAVAESASQHARDREADGCGRGAEDEAEGHVSECRARCARSSMSLIVSNVKVENVVYAPQNPVPSQIFGVLGNAW